MPKVITGPFSHHDSLLDRYPVFSVEVADAYYFFITSPESQATEKGKRPLYPSGTPVPKKPRLATDDHEGISIFCVAFSGRVNSHESKYFLKQIEAKQDTSCCSQLHMDVGLHLPNKILVFSLNHLIKLLGNFFCLYSCFLGRDLIDAEMKMYEERGNETTEYNLVQLLNLIIKQRKRLKEFLLQKGS